MAVLEATSFHLRKPTLPAMDSQIIRLQGREGFIVKGVVQTQDASGNVISEAPNTMSVTSEAYWQILGGRNTPVGEVFKYKATNVRVREALLGYTKALPNFFIKNIRIGIFAQNLFFIVNKAK